VRLDNDTPVLSSVILDLARARDVARDHAASLDDLLSDVEMLHEPGADGQCPTCRTPSPCLTHLLIRREITFAQACSVVRDHEPIDLVGAETRPAPPVPSLAELLAAPSPGLDRFFDALMRPAHAQTSE
jgi:hypothetical protein